MGTDVSCAANWMPPLRGVEAATALLTGSAKAGMSTAIGFAGLQTFQNVLLPRHKCWVDG